ncbi:MAG: M14 family zinc carboxypeptidase [Nocardioidaceae bacterium]
MPRRTVALPALRQLLAAAVACVGALVPSAATAEPPPQPVAVGPSAANPAVHAARVIGTSVRGRSIWAYRVGDRTAAKTVLVMAAMHGNEQAPVQIVQDLRRGAPVHGVNMWLVPIYNRDGAARDDRQNAHGVDLNRNYPVHWKPLTGNYYAGPAPASEPETRLFMRFMNRVNPDYVISFHQPLQGIDVASAKDRRFARTLATDLRLPVHNVDCSGRCHGTMTQWFNARHAGSAITVELGDSPARHYLHDVAPRGLLKAVGAARW